MLEVTFYADESGTHDPHGEQVGAEVAAIAGYIATKKQWETFKRRWNTALTKYKIPEFHMSEFNRHKPPYDSWTNAKRKRFLRALIRIARDNKLYGYASMVETKAWDTILDDETKGFPEFYNPYHTCLQNLFAKFPKFLKEEFDPHVSKGKPVEKIAFVFHRHQELGPAAAAGFEICKDVLDSDDRFSSITFGSSKDCVPLQVADLLAFYARRIFTRDLKGIPRDEFELALLERDNLHLIFLSPENLKDLRQKNEKVRQEREKANSLLRS